MIFVSSLISVLPLISGMFPYGFPMFSPIAMFFCCMVIIFKQGKLKFGQWIFAYFILAITYVFPLVISGNIYRPNYYDLLNIIVFFAFFLVLTTVIECKKDFEKYTMYFQFLTIITSIGFGLIGLYKFMLLLKDIKLPLFYREIGTYPWGTSLVSDYNVYSLSMLFGLVSMCFVFDERRRVWEKFALTLGGSVVFCAAALSGSRRSWIILPFILIFAFKIVLRGSVRALFLFKIKRSYLINLLAMVFVVSSIYCTYGIFSSGAVTLEVSEEHYLERMWNRLVGIRDIVITEDGRKSRTERYAFAGSILEEYGTLRLMIGDGGEYMRQYGVQFKDSGGFDKPHNPIISAFLHSGIIGGITVIGYLFVSLFFYIRNFNHGITRYFFYLFLITSFFSLTSSNNIFSKKIFVLLFLLPWLIDSVYSENAFIKDARKLCHFS
jgi:hypothetical protein